MYVMLCCIMLCMQDCGNVYTQPKTLNRTENEFPFIYTLSPYFLLRFTFNFFFNFNSVLSEDEARKEEEKM